MSLVRQQCCLPELLPSSPSNPHLHFLLCFKFSTRREGNQRLQWCVYYSALIFVIANPLMNKTQHVSVMHLGVAGQVLGENGSRSVETQCFNYTGLKVVALVTFKLGNFCFKMFLCYRKVRAHSDRKTLARSPLANPFLLATDGNICNMYKQGSHIAPTGNENMEHVQT